jgi:MFS transporter, DHA2 family, methylenomycin A resistance protein
MSLATGISRCGNRRGVVLAAATLGFGVIQLDVSVVNVAVKPIGVALGGDITTRQWVVDAYTLTFAALILSAGSLGDRLGARRMLLSGFVVFTVASAACGLVPSAGLLIAARAVQGSGAAALGACSLTLLNHTFPDGKRARAVGIWATGGAGALAAGPLIGGLLIAAAGWRLIFFINLPLGVAGWWLTARFAAESPRVRERAVDLPGQLASVITLTALTGATIEGGTAGFAAPVVVGGYALALAAGVSFVVIERIRDQPMLPPRLFRSAEFAATILIGLLINVVFYGLIFALSLFLQHQRGCRRCRQGWRSFPPRARSWRATSSPRVLSECWALAG